MCNYKGFENLYKIYEDGSIYSIRKNRFLKPTPNGNVYKYMYVCLVSYDRLELRTSVHRIVAHHFISEQPSSKHEVNHKDMDSTNNHWTNLEWLTHRENMLHARQRKYWKPSKRKPGFKVSEETKRKMAEKKMKEVALINDNEMFRYKSVEEFCTLDGMYRKKFNRLVNSHKTWNGFYIRFINN